MGMELSLRGMGIRNWYHPLPILLASLCEPVLLSSLCSASLCTWWPMAALKLSPCPSLEVTVPDTTFQFLRGNLKDLAESGMHSLARSEESGLATARDPLMWVWGMKKTLLRRRDWLYAGRDWQVSLLHT